MDKPNSSGGLWNCARPIAYSQETQDILKVLMQESHLANVQKRQIRECLKNGAPLYLACVSKASAPPQTKPSKSTSRGRPSRSQKRSMEQCKAGDSYVREKFRPGPTRDLEKEKRCFQKILEMGKDEPQVKVNQKPSSSEKTQEKDRTDEIVEEIEERQQFLNVMATLGKEQQFVSVINTEISQRMRELELLEKSSNKMLEEGALEGGTS